MTAQASTSVVELRQDGDVLLVSVNNPPVNALGAAVRQGLMAAMEQADASAAVKAVVIVGRARLSSPVPISANSASPRSSLSCPMSATVSRPAASPWWP
jgi:hypothetical protein